MDDDSGARQYAEVIDLGVQWETGAPFPHLVSNGSTAKIVCRAREPRPEGGVEHPRSVAPSDPEGTALVIIEFRGCRNIRFGAPNDEALSGHPLYGHGLQYYAAHKVHNSEWLKELIKINSRHPRHSEAQYQVYHHYFLAFQDHSFEAIARDVTAQVYYGVLGEEVATAAISVV